MGRKIFVSYKYADRDVYNITGSIIGSTVRDYVDEIEKTLGESDHIYKGESDGEDLSQLSEETIWKKLRDRIYDSTLTIVMISKNMRERWKADKDQWIPREISYSLKDVSRTNSSGDPVTSKSNAVLAVVVPDQTSSCAYYTYMNTCCGTPCRTYRTDTLFDILRENMFNVISANTKNCSTNNSTIWYGESSYIISVEWEDFVSDMNKYIDRAYQLRDNIDDYSITKEV